MLDQKRKIKQKNAASTFIHVLLLSAVSYLVAEHPAANERLWLDRHWHPEQSRPEISDMVSTQIDGRKMRGERTDVDRLAPLLQKTQVNACSYILSCNAANLVNHSSPSFWTLCLFMFRRTEGFTALIWIHAQKLAHFTFGWIKGFVPSAKSSSKYFK